METPGPEGRGRGTRARKSPPEGRHYKPLGPPALRLLQRTQDKKAAATKARATARPKNKKEPPSEGEDGDIPAWVGLWGR